MPRFKSYAVPALKNSLRILGQFLYPLKCLKCGTYIEPDTIIPHSMEACFCDNCMALGFYPIEVPFCLKCGGQFHHTSSENHVCEACLKTPLNLDRVRAVVAYKGIVKDAIPLFKYQSKLSVATVFERFLFQTFIRYYSTCRIDLIMPIPLHRKKLKKRGFNQSYLMIRNFETLYQKQFQTKPIWQIDRGSLRRVKPTASQTGFDITQRKNNLKNAFQVVNKQAVEEKNILLIDDVFTTGATCNEAAMELLKNGARKVAALVLART